jgi:hypothetical protein
VKELADRIDADRNPWEVAPAHGDFTHWNLYSVDGTEWLFDWESFAADAPVLSDKVRFLIGAQTRPIEANPRAIGDRLRRHFASMGHEDGHVLRALAFLHARRVRGATLLARNWSYGPKGTT